MRYTCPKLKKKDDTDEECNEPNRLLVLLYILAIVVVVITIGTIGFHMYAEHSWLDSFYNACLTFTATTVTVEVEPDAGKIFTSIYNVLSTIFILFILGIILRTIVEEDFLRVGN